MQDQALRVSEALTMLALSHPEAMLRDGLKVAIERVHTIRGTLPAPDPVFARIAEHRELWAASSMASEIEQEAATGREVESMRKLLRSVPATLPGLLAWLTYILDEPGVAAGAYADDFRAIRNTILLFGESHGAAA